MIHDIVSIDGHAVNDTTNLISTFPEGTVTLGPGGDPVFINLAYNPASNTTTNRVTATIAIETICKGTIHSQVDTLHQWFGLQNGAVKILIQDTANSNKQWYVYGVFVRFRERKGNMIVSLWEIADFVWTAQTATTTAWAVTGTGDTQVVANAGNFKARPVFTLTPNAVKTVGTAGVQLYRAFFAVVPPVAFANYTYDIADASWDTAALIADNSNKAQLNGAVNNSVQTFDYDTVTGTLPTAGMAYIDTEQFSWTGKSGTQLTGITRGIGGTTAASHLDNAVFKVSYMQANGADIRVYVDGTLQDRWLDGWNGANSQLFVNLTCTPPIFASYGSSYYFKLGAAIAGAGAITTITMDYTSGGAGSNFWTQWNALPRAGILQIGTELFTYTSRTGDQVIPAKFGGVTRTVKDSAIAAHAAGDVVSWIEHDISVYFGDPAAVAPTIPASRQPMIDITQSTNGSHVWTEFFDTTGSRALAWLSSAVVPNAPTNTSRIYTGNRTATANPATEAGEAIEAYLSGGSYQSPACTLRWVLNHPVGITAVTATGEKYRVGSAWPSARMIGGRSSATLVAWTEATPASASTWTSWSSHSSVSVVPTGQTYAQSLTLELAGSVSTSAGAVAYTEMESLTATVYSTYIPVVTRYITAPAPTSPTNYDINGTLTNTTTGEVINVRFQIALGQSLQIDCAAHTATYLFDNTTAIAAITPANEDSYEWISLSPGNNTLQWDETGVTDMTISVVQNDRQI